VTLRLTWEWTDAGGERDADADARAVAAVVGVLEGVESATPDVTGVLVELGPEPAKRADLATAARKALAGDDLRTRAATLAKRIPAYANLAKSLALDDRVSPMPEVARQAATRRSSPMRMIPGLQLVSQVTTILPVLTSISSRSRDASPEVVTEHLTAAGLSREIVDSDLATAREATAFVKSYTADTAMKVASRAGTLAGRARVATQQWIDQRNQKPRRE
jgi:hypothetical protein